MNHVVAVVGGACSGSEIAYRLSELNMDVVVFEQNDLPYGKIEDGLPRWHEKLQKKEEKMIDERMSHSRVHFVPRCKIGRDLSLDELLNEWRLPIIVLANGAWRDRPFRTPGAENVKDDSLIYQNAFVYWFNHYEEKNYQGQRFEVKPGSIVIGGGLASIDMAKACQFELVRKFLQGRGKDASVHDLDRFGVHKVLEKAGHAYAELNVEPTKLYYRKRVRDMPLVPMGEAPSAEKLIKAEGVREKIIKNAQSRYGFEVHELRMSSQIHTESGSITAVTFDKKAYVDGKYVGTGETETVQTSMVISSIGSIPEAIEGVPMDGELYRWENRHTGAFTGLPGVYCVGNAITGRGNIKDSAANARRLGAAMTSAVTDGVFDYETWFKTDRENAKKSVEKLQAYLAGLPEPSEAQRSVILGKVKHLREQRRFKGSYLDWRDGVFAAR